MPKIELTEGLIDLWQVELAKQVQRCQQIARDVSSDDTRQQMLKKADFLEGQYALLTCLLRAARAQRSVW